ncbi:2OG-Fe(II) oxygenase [Nannocystis sp.]|uniref:2OG-Fe(II) oxygenase n=1 Tax=Nannocystis sp. TaxID=1962667 RepID=UPI002429BEEE|nr:2OG-Fe(II) oxygenase [Nannocystis sp.]MBK7823893.1 2OG-Fe(II) oxygenase [Nannocystis sp.]MBK9754903.1 2OG-Fe(II) oxygenase [Nannocystis sp.]
MSVTTDPLLPVSPTLTLPVSATLALPVSATLALPVMPAPVVPAPLVGVDPPELVIPALAPVSLAPPLVPPLPASPQPSTSASTTPTRRSTTMTRTLLRGRRAEQPALPPSGHAPRRPDDRRITLHSVLVYFNDDFSGGETRFLEPIERTIIPRRGAALVFQHKLRHEGCVVHSGRKYAMRSDLVYEAAEPLRMPGT